MTTFSVSIRSLAFLLNSKVVKRKTIFGIGNFEKRKEVVGEEKYREIWGVLLSLVAMAAQRAF